MSDLLARAAAEIVIPPEAPCDESKVRRSIAVDILTILYTEVHAYAGIKLNAEARSAVNSGEVQYYMLGSDAMAKRFQIIEDLIEQSEGQTREAKITELFQKKEIFGEAAAKIYVATLELFQTTRDGEMQQRVRDAVDTATLRSYLKAKRPSKAMRRWVKEKRRHI